MNYRTNKSWAEHHKFQLWIAYQLRTPLKIMEQYFHRSPTALNKCLMRYGIRDAVKNDRTPGEYPRKITNITDLRNTIIKCGMDDTCIGLAIEQNGIWTPNNDSIMALQDLGICMPKPWQDDAKSTNNNMKTPPKLTLKIRPKKPELSKFVSLQACINYLIKSGHKVSLFEKKNPYNWTHIINNTPKSETEVLVCTNKERQKQEKPVYFVQGLTED